MELRISTLTRCIMSMALLLCILSISGCKAAKEAVEPPPAMEVGIVSVRQHDVSIYGDWVGNLDGYVNAAILPEVSGYLLRQNYHEGQHVRKGDVLFEIDPRPYLATLDQARGQLDQAKAQLQLYQINVKRDTPLVAIHALAQSQLDSDTQSVAQYEAVIKSDEASIESAQLNLGWTKVRALVDGIAGRATTQVGNLASTSTTLTTVSQVNPIKVFFAISEQEYLDLIESAKQQGATDLLKIGNKIPLELTLANGNKYPYQGSIVFVDRNVDNTTGTISIAGAFPNPGEVLRPGQFAKIRALTSVRHNALSIPQRAILDQQGQHVVMVVGADNIAKTQKVTVGPQIGQDWIVTDGLKAGARVVAQGNGKIRDGMPLKPVADQATTEGSR